MESRLDSKIKGLKEMVKLYQELVKKDYSYNYRLDAIYDQLEILEELKSGGSGIIENWMECYKEDSSN